MTCLVGYEIYIKQIVLVLLNKIIVKQKHRRLLEVARALKIQEVIPDRYWNHSVLTTYHIINLTPSKVLNNKSPYEVLCG